MTIAATRTGLVEHSARDLPNIVVFGAFRHTAADYHARGLNVLPIVAREKVPPRGLNWKQWQWTPQTPDEIARLIAENPAADVAVICGPVSHVVDIETDGSHGEDALRSLQLPLPPTAMFTAPRGTHRLFRCERPLPTRRALRPQLDVRAVGAYVVVPPSPHRAWWSPRGFDDLIPLPPAWETYLQPKGLLTAPPKSEEASNEISRYLLPQGFGGLEEFFRREDVAAAIADIWRLPRTLGQGFRCILPGHTERRPSASLWRNAAGLVVYHDWHARGGLEFLTLPQVRAAMAYGEVRRLRAPELATWALRLLVEAKILQPAAVMLPDFPPAAPAVLRRVRDGFEMLLGCKWLHTPGAPTAFSWRFAAAWCGVGERQAGDAMRQLIRLGMIRPAGTWGRLALWLPGGPARRDVDPSGS